MGMIKARDALLRQLICDGMNVVFGNPGSTEENFLEAVGENTDITYIMGLQEASVAAMADGWARVSRKPAVCQIHSAVGLGNAMGVLYEAQRSHTPMIMFAGEPPVELQAFDGFLAGDLAKIAMPLTKWSARVTPGRQLLRMLRRAIKVAATPPYGPVFLALPMDVLDELVDEADIIPTSLIIPPASCSQSDAEEIARKLIEAKTPMLIVGDGVSEAGARDVLHELADLLAIPTWGMEFNELCMSFRDPMFMGLIGHSFGSNTRSITMDADVLLAIGTPVFPELFPSVENYFQKDAVLMQIDRDPWEIAKNFPVYLGVQADPKGSIELIIKAIRKMQPSYTDAVKSRRIRVIAENAAAFLKNKQTLEAIQDTPEFMSPNTMMRTLVNEMPEDAMIYDEALTSTGALLHQLQPDKDGSYILARGGCIGVGWPGAVGAAVAERGRTVIAPSGDGSALFALQTLWTAVNHRLKVVFIVCNNGAYRILKINLLHYQKSAGEKPGPFPFMDLDEPRIDFARLAEGFGMKALRAKNPDQLRTALREAFTMDGPMLIDVMLNGSVEGEIQSIFSGK